MEFTMSFDEGRDAHSKSYNVSKQSTLETFAMFRAFFGKALQ